MPPFSSLVSWTGAFSPLGLSLLICPMGLLENITGERQIRVKHLPLGIWHIIDISR